MKIVHLVRKRRQYVIFIGRYDVPLTIDESEDLLFVHEERELNCQCDVFFFLYISCEIQTDKMVRAIKVNMGPLDERALPRSSSTLAFLLPNSYTISTKLLGSNTV